MIYGGKITTYRRLAEEALDHFAPFFALKPAWTGGVALPGGDFPHDGVAQQVTQALARWPYLGEARAQRMVRAYGTRLDRVLGDARTADALGEDFGAGLSASEVRYLMKFEWARTADDVLWRRSKLGLHLSMAQREAVARFMAGQPRAGEPGHN
jgi:glycerol-3-phosphate dehydrogenase